MGTRVDFYSGKGKDAEWLGSYPFDGYPDNKEMMGIFRTKTEKAFRKAVYDYLTLFVGNGSTFPKQGWPWPWKDSNTTDYAYAFFGGKVQGSCFGSPWFNPIKPPKDIDSLKGLNPEFPNMESKKSMTLGKRSGLLVFKSA